MGRIITFVIVFVFAAYGFSTLFIQLLKKVFKTHIPHHKYNITITKANGGSVPRNEPLYVFRAQDKYAGDVLRYYASRLTGDLGADYIVAKDALQWAKEFDRWPIHKIPD